MEYQDFNLYTSGDDVVFDDYSEVATVATDDGCEYIYYEVD